MLIGTINTIIYGKEYLKGYFHLKNKKIILIWKIIYQVSHVVIYMENINLSISINLTFYNLFHTIKKSMEAIGI
jgi:hypothetical protein